MGTLVSVTPGMIPEFVASANPHALGFAAQLRLGPKGGVVAVLVLGALVDLVVTLVDAVGPAGVGLDAVGAAVTAGVKSTSTQ